MAATGRAGILASGLTPRRILIVAAIFIVLYFSLLIASNWLTRVQLQREEQALRVEITALEWRATRLQSVRAYMQSDAFIEAVARENGLVRPGETAVIQVGPETSATTELRPGDPWWMRFLNERDRR